MAVQPIVWATSSCGLGRPPKPTSWPSSAAEKRNVDQIQAFIANSRTQIRLLILRAAHGRPPFEAYPLERSDPNQFSIPWECNLVGVELQCRHARVSDPRQARRAPALSIATPGQRRMHVGGRVKAGASTDDGAEQASNAPGRTPLCATAEECAASSLRTPGRIHFLEPTLRHLEQQTRAGPRFRHACRATHSSNDDHGSRGTWVSRQPPHLPITDAMYSRHPDDKGSIIGQ